jgi:hypothetical protein
MLLGREFYGAERGRGAPYLASLISLCEFLVACSFRAACGLLLITHDLSGGYGYSSGVSKYCAHSTFRRAARSAGYS